MYMGIISLWNKLEDSTKASRIIAILTIAGSLNIPIIKFSVNLWNTLHQPASILRLGGSTVATEILTPLLLMTASFTLLFFGLHILAMRNEIFKQRFRSLMAISCDGS